MHNKPCVRFIGSSAGSRAYCKFRNALAAPPKASGAIGKSTIHIDESSAISVIIERFVADINHMSPGRKREERCRIVNMDVVAPEAVKYSVGDYAPDEIAVNDPRANRSFRCCRFANRHIKGYANCVRGQSINHNRQGRNLEPSI